MQCEIEIGECADWWWRIDTRGCRVEGKRDYRSRKSAVCAARGYARRFGLTVTRVHEYTNTP